MAISRALFAGDDPTPDSVKRRMALAELLREQGQDISHVDSPLEAIGSVLQSGAGYLTQMKAQKDQDAGLSRRSSAQQALAAGLLGGSPSGTYTMNSSTAPGASGGGAATSTASAGSASAGIPIGDGNDIYNTFIDTVKTGVKNPFALAAIAATGKAESSYSPGNVYRQWSDPSQSGKPGMAGGIMSWRAERLENMRNFAAQNGGDPNRPSPQLQAQFFLSENPALIEKLNNAQSVEEAQSAMNRAWAFAGWDQPGGEASRRLATAQSYLPQFQGGGPAVAAASPPQQPVQVASTDPTVGVAQATGGAPTAQPAASNQQVAQLLTQGAPQPPPSAMSGVSREQIAQLLADPYTEDLGQQLLQQVLADEQVRQQAGYKAGLDRAETLDKRAYDDGIRRENNAREDRRNAEANADRDRDFTFRVEQGNKPPTSVQEYEYARSQGFTGTFGEWETQNRKASANTVSVNTGEGDKFYENLDRKNAERFATLSDGGQNARGRQAQVDQLDALLKQSPSGIEAAAKTWLGDMGIATEGLNSLQASVALIEKMVPEQREPGSGPMSDADIAGFRRSLPRTINQPGGNELIIGRLRAINEYDISRGEIADMVADRAITPADGRKRLRELANPLDGFTDEVRKLGEAAEPRVSEAPQTRMVDGVPVGAASIPRAATAGQGADPVQIKSEEEFLALPSGATFISPDGKIRRKP